MPDPANAHSGTGKAGSSRNSDLMARASPELHDLARRVLATEADSSHTPQEMAEAMARACKRLHQRLDLFVGAGGFHALISRALFLARKEFSWLDKVHVEEHPGCVLNGLRESVGGVDAAEASAGFAALIANVIWLLATFIGEDITLDLVHETWPAIGNAAAGSVGKKELSDG